MRSAWITSTCGLARTLLIASLCAGSAACPMSSDDGVEEDTGLAADTSALTLSATIDDATVGTATNQFSYTGKWTNCVGCQPTGAYQNAFRWANATGASFTLRFSGAAARITSYREPVGGIAHVTLDGKAQADIDLYAPTKALAAVYTTPTLAAGTHTLTLSVSGKRNAASKSTSLTIDKAEIFTDPPPPAPPSTPAPAPSSGTWLSGSGGSDAAAFATWRGRPLDIVSTWADSDAGQLGLWPLYKEYKDWQKSIDLAIGAIDAGETWSAAASGAYDNRWRQSLTNMKSLWGSRPGTVYIRFAHELNGSWYPWNVTSSNASAFVSGWKRFRSLQKQIFPAAKLVFCVNRESSAANNIDWRTIFPGTSEVDVMSVDYYNQYPYVGTTAEWSSAILQYDAHGAPKGLQRHLEFARSVGLPLAVSEWSGNADMGDSPVFIQSMHDFFAANAGTGAGKLLYESQFNDAIDGGRWSLYPNTKMAQSAARYRELF